MKEQSIVIAKTYPSISRKYASLVCVGTLKHDGNFRRIYPVPWKLFWHRNGFRKKYLIEYELQEDLPSDHRQESRKVKPETFKEIKEMNFGSIKSILDAKVTSLEELKKIDHKKVSMGVIIPEILDFIIEKNPHYEKNMSKKQQQTLDGRSAVKIDILPWSFSYIFKCCKSCPKSHKIMCEDWEVAELYRNCKKYQEEGKYKDEQEVLEKVKHKMLNVMKEKRVVYFIMGTHYRFDTYIIISIIYPRKKDRF
jgi:hypothetical protein